LVRLTPPSSVTPAIDAAILAGGRASRLQGRDKALLAFGEGRVVDRQIAALRAVASRIVIVGGPPRPLGDDIIAREDLFPGGGPLGGIYTALRSATTRRMLVVACDMPFLTAAFLAYLASAGHGCDVAVPRDARGRHPLCASWDVGAAERLEHLLAQGVRAVSDALRVLRVHVIGEDALGAFDPGGRLLHNINTPDDLARAMALRG
jgi:molybdopterin-guanine dinucleotide biosynthesis protein A